MRTGAFALSAVGTFLCVALALPAFAHPGSGIVVDGQGQVFFQDTGARTIWKVDAQGKTTKYTDQTGGHWMALDAEGSFACIDLKPFVRITPPGVKPALIVADGGAPIAVGADGNLYYGRRFSGANEVATGLTKFSPRGERATCAPGLTETIEKLGITGLASAPDGCLYVASSSAVLQVKADGTFTMLAHPIVVSDCDEDLPGDNPSPYMRGVAVDSRGVVYAAATGCHRIVTISHDGKVETVLKAERPWSPTGVAVHGGDVYVLEYTNATMEPAAGWLPRVRKLGRDGKVTTVVTITPEMREHVNRKN